MQTPCHGLRSWAQITGRAQITVMPCVQSLSKLIGLALGVRVRATLTPNPNPINFTETVHRALR